MSDRPLTLFEVGPRDGLQNESHMLPLETKIWFISQLLKAGVQDFEMGAFVRPDRVPQMADTEALYRSIESGALKLGRARPWSLVPNVRGMERAIASGAKYVSIFTAASETFNQHNIGMSIKQSLLEHETTMKMAKKHGLKVRGYVSTSFGCPYEGKVAPKKTLKVIERLLELGVYQVSVGDTIGVAVPKSVDAVVKPALRMFGRKKIAVHFHDTRGTALANTLRSYDHGVRSMDASAGGLGGCPYAPGASGNLATEDLVYMLEGMGVKTGIKLNLLAETSIEMSKRMQRPLTCKYLQAFQFSRIKV